MKKIHLIKDDNYSDDFFIVFYIIILLQLIIGIIFLIPPILGAVFFILNVFGLRGNIISLGELGTNWTGGTNAMSAAPIYLGLMAIAGTLIIYFAIKTVFYSGKVIGGVDSITDLEITEE